MTETETKKKKTIEERRCAPHIYLMNEETNKLHRFEVLDKVEHDGRRYIVLYPAKEPRIVWETLPKFVDEDEEALLILELYGEYSERIKDQELDTETLGEVLLKFKERKKDIYQFDYGWEEEK